MLEVHPPEHTPHTWRDFFIHIATIVIGLLIAVGLEQTVEALHHRHQRQELLQSLLEDTRKATRDSEEYERAIDRRSAWLQQRIADVRSAIFTHQPLAVPAPFPSETPNVPDSPSWTAASSSGLLTVLSQDEVRSLGESATLALMFRPIAIEVTAHIDKTLRFDQHFLVSTTPLRFDYSPATPAELKEYLDLLLTHQMVLHRADLWLRYIRGANAAVLAGSRNLEDIEKSEDRFLPTPPAN